MAGAIAVLCLWHALDGFTTGATTVGSRGGHAVRIHLSGWRAYLSATATLLFGLACLSVTVGCVAGTFAPQRYANSVGPTVFRLFHLGWRLTVAAGVLAFMTAVSYFFR